MAVPSIPADVSTSGSISSSHMNSVLDHVAWWHGNAGGSGARPLFKGQAWSDVGNDVPPIGASNATNTTFGFGSAGSFQFTPIINVGGWTVASADADPESLVVPEAGVYWVSIFAEVGTGDADGYRQIRLMVDGSVTAHPGIEANHDNASTALINRIGASGVIDVAANTELDVQVYQNSGASMDTIDVYLTAIWMQST